MPRRFDLGRPLRLSDSRLKMPSGPHFPSGDLLCAIGRPAPGFSGSNIGESYPVHYYRASDPFIRHLQRFSPPMQLLV